MTEPTLKAGDKTYALVESLNAYCALEERTGKRAAEHMLEAASGSMLSTRALLWAHLQLRHSAEFETFEQVGALIDRVGVAEVTAQIERLLNPPATKAPKAARRKGRKS